MGPRTIWLTYLTRLHSHDVYEFLLILILLDRLFGIRWENTHASMHPSVCSQLLPTGKLACALRPLGFFYMYVCMYHARFTHACLVPRCRAINRRMWCLLEIWRFSEYIQPHHENPSLCRIYLGGFESLSAETELGPWGNGTKRCGLL